MRVKTKAKDLKEGDLAFLPFYDKLLKSRITKVAPVADGMFINVHYHTLSQQYCLFENMCTMDPNSVYEVYQRKCNLPWQPV